MKDLDLNEEEGPQSTDGSGISGVGVNTTQFMGNLLFDEGFGFENFTETHCTTRKIGNHEDRCPREVLAKSSLMAFARTLRGQKVIAKCLIIKSHLRANFLAKFSREILRGLSEDTKCS